ncbi:MAG TPA: GIY-YIG nuclease family protein [Vicinamibacterales bacterium]|nr:GIY-YIG nuclease family protein [Vicinamibacterales bacterium]
MALPKCIVYVLRSTTTPARYYTALTSNITARLDAHNAGLCPHTADGKPWIVDVIIEFSDERRAVAFERYLKSGSGVAFSKRHLR